ncbi:P-loop NTPase family protein [Paenibacillus alkalitolerans]|uniref:hypothetical protein n=1 Tax=Paenibacillus alkalitolerans TaxID=2799335 RepID=UPI0018F60CF4|nr:hypothetical protein [Paenibacillus alkalitolerans]
MARQVIALCDPDLDYAVKVAAIANRIEGRGNIEVVAFGDPSALAIYQSVERPHLFAINAIWKKEVKEAIGDACVIWLTDDRPAGNGNEPLVYKYQPVTQLIKAMLGEAGLQPSDDCKGAERYGRKTAAVISVWSAGGGAGKSTVAALLSEAWNKSVGGGVFCLGLEAGLTAGMWLTEEGRHDASDWLYEMKTGNRLRTTAETGFWSNVESFRNDCSMREIALLSKSDAGGLIRRAANMPGCKTVIIDCETGWSERSECAWEESDVIVCLTGEDAASRAKIERWMAEWPGWQEGGAFRRKTVFVSNKSLLSSTNGAGSGWISLPYVSEWKQIRERDLHRHPAYRHSLLQLIEGISSKVAAP